MLGNEQTKMIVKMNRKLVFKVFAELREERIHAANYLHVWAYTHTEEDELKSDLAKMGSKFIGACWVDSHDWGYKRPNDLAIGFVGIGIKDQSSKGIGKRIVEKLASKGLTVVWGGISTHKILVDLEAPVWAGKNGKALRDPSLAQNYNSAENRYRKAVGICVGALAQAGYSLS